MKRKADVRVRPSADVGDSANKLTKIDFERLVVQQHAPLETSCGRCLSTASRRSTPRTCTSPKHRASAPGVSPDREQLKLAAGA